MQKQHLPWFLLGVVTIVPLLTWLASYNWRPSITIAGVFPLLGVLAWSIMATHYYFGWLKIKFPEYFHADRLYGSITMWLVLALLLLHPGLLAWQQFRVFGTLPPESFYATVADAMAPFIAMGVFALVLFLTYEALHRFRQNERIKSLWGWVSLSQVIAMTLIFIHGLAVGQTVLTGWMVGWWVLLGVLLLPAFYEIVRHDWLKQKEH